jgi:hypothetical protein
LAAIASAAAIGILLAVLWLRSASRIGDARDPTPHSANAAGAINSYRRIEQSEFDAAKLSGTDPRQTLLWVARQIQQQGAANISGADSAIDREAAAFDTVTAMSKGTHVQWPCSVEAVQTGAGGGYYLDVQHFAVPFHPDGTTELDENLPDDLFPLWVMELQGFKMTDRRWPAALRKGDDVIIHGTIKEISRSGWGGNLPLKGKNRSVHAFVVSFEDGYSVRTPGQRTDTSKAGRRPPP